MAHFAELDEDNTVLRVIVISNGQILDFNTQQESEEIGVAYCKSLFGQNTRWIQTSINANFRKCYAGEGYKYSPEKDIFYPPKPSSTWVLDDDLNWIPPVAKPEVPTGYIVVWDEEEQEWDVMIDRSNIQ
jgi:hypothetical protein